MIKNYAILFWLLLFAASQAKADTKHFPSTISEVTVYLQGAMVKRTAQVKLEPGTNEIILDGLSNYLDINSVRLESNSNVTILSVNASTNYLSPVESSDEEKKLQIRLDTLNNRMARLNNEITSLNDELEMLKQNYRVTINEKSAFVDVLENSADFYQKRMKEVLNDLTVLLVKRGELNTKTAAINSQIAEINNKNRNPKGEITFTATATGYSDAGFTFTYYVSNAGWTPMYNMRAENTTSTVALDYDAEVTQTTGEDWKDVKLILSTGNPSVNGIKPRMEVARLDFAAPVLKLAGTQPGNIQVANGYYTTTQNDASADDGSDKYDEKGVTTTDNYSTGDIKYASAYTSLNQNVLATTFDIDLKYEILSNGIAKHVRIQQYNLPAQFSFSTLPRICTDAFLEANITGWEEYNLLPGSVNIFLEKGFVGKSFIDPSTTKDTLTVSFGKDKKINIRRIRVKNFTKNQFLGSNKIQYFGYATSIRNTKKTPITIKVEDQMPVSNQKDIVVEMVESAGAQVDKTTGIVSWTITLQPNEEKALKFEYTIKYPKGKVVTGI